MMFRSDSQRRAMFANMFSGSVSKFSFGPKKKAKVIAEILSEPGSGSSDTHLGSVVPEDVSKDIVYDDETFASTDGVYIKYVPEAEVVGEPVGVSLESRVDEVPNEVQQVESLDDYFNMNKEKIESSPSSSLYGEGAVIVVDGDKTVDIKATKKTKSEDLLKFSNTPPLSKKLFDVYVADRPKNNPMAKYTEDVILYPGALGYNPVTAFDDDYKKFNNGEIFNSKGTTDWKKFSLKPKSLFNDSSAG